MITKAILIKPADKWMVRVWESVEPTTATIFGRINFNNWLNKYKEYEVHPDYTERFEQEAMKKISFNYSFVNLNYDLINKGIDLNPELIGFKTIVIDWDIMEGDIEKTYAVLKEVDNERDYGAGFKKACSIVSESLDVDSVWVELFNDLDKWSRSTKSSKDTPIKINELKQKYTLKLK